jgi:hypothetical protein
MASIESSSSRIRRRIKSLRIKTSSSTSLIKTSTSTSSSKAIEFNKTIMHDDDFAYFPAAND